MSDPTWRALVSGEKQPAYRCLALRILMIRIRVEYDRDASALQALIRELRDFFVANLRFAAPDYQSIFRETAR
nr:hypothetical protein [Sphingomonas vulcanisoli]